MFTLQGNKRRGKKLTKIRLEVAADGNKSIYLDDYYKKGVRKYEYLKFHCPRKSTCLQREQNKADLAKLQNASRQERIKALHGHGIQDWETVKAFNASRNYLIQLKWPVKMWCRRHRVKRPLPCECCTHHEKYLGRDKQKVSFFA